MYKTFKFRFQDIKKGICLAQIYNLLRLFFTVMYNSLNWYTVHHIVFNKRVKCCSSLYDAVDRLNVSYSMPR